MELIGFYFGEQWHLRPIVLRIISPDTIINIMNYIYFGPATMKAQKKKAK